MPDQDAKPIKLGLRVAEYGQYLVTRKKGQQIREAALVLLAEHPEAAALFLNFDGVEAITNACADELVAKLIGDQSDHRIFVTRCSEAVWDALLTVLPRRGLKAEDHIAKPDLPPSMLSREGPSSLEAALDDEPESVPDQDAALRQRYAEAIGQNMILRKSPGEIADAVLAVDREEIAALRRQLATADAGIAHQNRRIAYVEGRAEQAEAEREQLRYERQLLGAARMVLDLMVSGEPYRWEQTRQEAEDISQRIVDEIGHPVTDEPALGPGYRAEITDLRERLDLANRAMAAATGLTALRQRAEQAEAERDRMNQALRDAGIEYPLGARGIADLAAMANGRLEDLETAEASIARVHALAESWAALTPPNDWGSDVPPNVIEAGRAVLAALDESEAQHG